MKDDPFELFGPPVQVIIFTKLVFGVAFGILLSQVVVAVIVFGVLFSMGAIGQYRLKKQQEAVEQAEFDQWRAEKKAKIEESWPAPAK